jgi:ABC-2 type transport system permease protein
MQTDKRFDAVREHGWHSGLANLWLKESQVVWGNGRWWRQGLLWIALLDGFYLIMLLTLTLNTSATQDLSALATSVIFYVSFLSLFINAGVIVLLQGAIIQEKQRGTAAWILSKPVSRSSFILAKCAALPEMLLTMVLVPGLIALGELFLILHTFPSLDVAFLLLAWLMCGLYFYFCLTLLLGTLFQSRTPVIGIGLLLIMILSQLAQQVTQALMSHNLLIPIFTLVALIVFAFLFLGIAIKRFEYQEL